MSDMPFRGLKSARKRTAFFEKCDELAKRVCCAKQVHQYSLCTKAFLEELAKRTYHAKRVHPLSMNTHPLAELPVAKRG